MKIWILIIVFFAIGMSAFSQWNWLNPKPQGNTLNKMFYLNPYTAFFVGEHGAFLKTIDGGNSWISYNTGISGNLNSVFFCNSDTGFVAGSDGLIMKTLNGGQNWNILNSSTTKTLYAVFFINSSLGFAVGDSGTIINTSNGGQSWLLKPVAQLIICMMPFLHPQIPVLLLVPRGLF